ncbi:MAG: DUF5681 domain-containing protein [Pseudolabrys sp.]
MVFKPGKSGNPSGKPKGARNKTTVAMEKLRRGYHNKQGNRTSEKRRPDRAAAVPGANNSSAQGSPGELRYAGD